MNNLNDFSISKFAVMNKKGERYLDTVEVTDSSSVGPTTPQQLTACDKSSGNNTGTHPVARTNFQPSEVRA